MKCFFCRKDVAAQGKIGRGETCPHCGSDLKVCKNCGFYDSRVYNECREHQAERVVDKTRANYCEFFEAGAGPGGPGQAEKDRAEALKKAAEALFKKS